MAAYDEQKKVFHEKHKKLKLMHIFKSVPREKHAFYKVGPSKSDF